MKLRGHVNVLALVGASAVLGGCAPGIPAHTWTNHDDALRIISERARSVETLAGACRVVLHDPQGGSVTLDGAIVARPPNHLRLQGWKFAKKVLDLTVTPNGTWLEIGGDAGADAEDRTALEGLDAHRVAEAWALATGDVLAGGPVQIDDTGGPTFEVHAALPEQDRSVVYTVDRRTLTVTGCRVLDARGDVHHVMSLDRYRLIDGIAWPTRVAGTSGARRFVLELFDVQLNGALVPVAFVPPQLAVRQP